ncbi:hypothetical protein ABID22_004029 [Pontibacter aydingkolensis]|uniref:SBBP repeat-containing protein n=1 Tax=Pontibacter aydingkolensis TaxID=1911536 RepID=A0ABS7D0Q0_9BACT|nr:SBBP repeat-containing protein [Pontibacter aydingkolensis]MBW7469285.1 SBBP repeat-containing protein [Pontibacter aydingkolensis]
MSFQSVQAQTRQFIWAQQSKKTSGTTAEVGRAATADAIGNVYVTGYFQGTVTIGGESITSLGSDDIFIAKYNVLGTLQWVRTAGGIGADTGNGIDVDGLGNVYVTGNIKGGSATFDHIPVTYSNSSNEIFVAKYDTYGTVQWVRTGSEGGAKVGYAITADDAGNSYITGYFAGNNTKFGSHSLPSIGNNDIFIVKYDPSGTAVWAKSAGSSGGGANGHDGGQSIVADASGNLYITGYFSGNAKFGNLPTIDPKSSNQKDAFIAKYNTSGDAIWARSVGIETTYTTGEYGITLDMGGNAYITGAYIGTATIGGTTLTNSGGADIYVAKYSTNGVVEWVRKAGSTNVDLPYGITTDGSGNTVVTGYFSGIATFDGGGTIVPVTSTGGTDIFIAKYSPAGTLQWVEKGGGTGNDYGYGAAQDNFGNAYIAGSFVTQTTFGSTPTLTTSGTSMFIAKIGITITWEGSVSTAWANANNWKGGVGPTAADDVTIPSGLTQYPVLSTSAQANSIILGSGNSSLRLAAGGDLTVHGFMALSSGSNLIMEEGSNSLLTVRGQFVTFGGTLTSGSDATVRLASQISVPVPALTFPSLILDSKPGTRLDFINNITVKGNLVLNSQRAGTGRIILSGGTAPHQISGTQPIINIELNDSQGAVYHEDIPISGTLTLTNGPFTATKRLRLDTGSTLSMVNGSLVLNNFFDYTPGTLNMGTGTVRFASNISLTVPNLAYHNLVLEGVAGTMLTIGSNITVNKDLQVASTGFTLHNDHTLTVKGNLDYHALRSGSGKVVLSGGTAAHRISASRPLGNLELDDVRGAVHTTDITIAGLLTLRNGKLSAEAGKKLTLDGSLDTSLGSSEDTGRLYEGALVKKLAISGTGTHLFGNIGLSFDNIGGGNWGEVTVTRITGPGSAVTNPEDPTKQGIERNWNISPTVQANSSVNLTLSWLAADNNGLDFTTKEAQVYKSTDNGATWFTVGNPLMATSSGNWRGVTVRAKSFSRWTVSNSVTPLPVELVHFEAIVTEQETVALRWETASESDNYYFAVERSSDSKEFVEISRVKGRGTTSTRTKYAFTDREPLSGTSYYRLRQVDLDGTEKYSPLRGVSLKRSNTVELHLYPNPVKGAQVNLLVKGLTQGEEAVLQLTDPAGKLVMSQPITQSQLVLQVESLSPGVYLVRVSGGHFSQTIKMVVL